MANPNPSPKTRFRKGQSGNPKGRVKLPDIRDALAKILADEKDGYTALEATLMALRAKAVKGDIRAAEALLDRAFGRPKQAIDHTTDGKALTPTRIEWVVVDPNLDE
jgi:alkylation response protein AidB-like acyl-CoA dehydrogenase